MKIGVDIRLLSRPLTGLGRYTLEMCRALSNIKNVSLYLYSPAPIRDDIIGLEKATIRNKTWENGILRQLWSQSYLPLWAKKDGLDVFWGPAHCLPRWLPKNIARVVTIHDLVWVYAKETMRPFLHFLERYQMPLAVRIADNVVTDSQTIADAVKQKFTIDSDKLSVVPPGTNLAKSIAPFKSLQQFGIDRPYFLFVGTLEPRKNLIRLLKAYSRLEESLKKQTMLVIVGGKGWGNININNTIFDLGLKKHIRLLGYVDDSILATLYTRAQFLAMPSLYEGFGLPLIEAMMCGTPVLTSSNSSMPEVAGDGGLFVDAKNIGSITNGLKKLITNEKLRSTLASKAKNNATGFNWNESAQQLMSVFEKAISVRYSLLS